MTADLMKNFDLKFTFSNVSSLKEGESLLGDIEEYFNVPWRIYINRSSAHLSLFFSCRKSLDAEKWSIETEFELKMSLKKTLSKKCNHSFGNEDGNSKMMSFGWPEFIEWEGMRKDYWMDDKLIVEAHVSIKKMTGFYGENLKNFDAMRDFSDGSIWVNDKEFPISKLYLSAQSTYFKSLFLGWISKKIIKFTSIDQDDFQKYLEILYGESVIDENTVEALLSIGAALTTPSVVDRCEKYLIEKSRKTLKKRLQLALKYNLEKLKSHCFESMKSNSDVRSVIPRNLSEIDRQMLELLLQKALSFG